MSANRVVVWSLWVLSLVLATHFGASAQFGPGQNPPGAEVRFVPSFGPPIGRAQVQAEHDMLLVVFERMFELIRQGDSAEDMLAAAAAKVDPSLEKIATSTSASGNPLAQATHLAVLGLMDAPSCSAIISIFDIRQVLFLSEPLPVRLRRLRQLLSNAAAAPPTKFPGVPVPAASPTPRGSPGRAVFSWLS